MATPIEPSAGTYQHFKGAFYEVLGIADEAESGKRLVVYKALGVMEGLLPDDPADTVHLAPVSGSLSVTNKNVRSCPVDD